MCVAVCESIALWPTCSAMSSAEKHILMNLHLNMFTLMSQVYLRTLGLTSALQTLQKSAKIIFMASFLRALKFFFHGNRPLRPNVCGYARTYTVSGLLGFVRLASSRRNNPPRVVLDLLLLDEFWKFILLNCCLMS